MFEFPAETCLIWDDWGLVDDDVHEPDDVGPVLEVEQHGGVAVHVAPLGPHLDAHHLRHHRHLGLEKGEIAIQSESINYQ